MTREIGGYFEFEYVKNIHYHQDAIKLNSARYALVYLLKIKEYKKIYMPYYICYCVIEVVQKMGIDIQFYNIDEELMPSSDIKLKNDEVILVVNYFGLNSNKIKTLKDKYDNLVVDNTQAFFIRPLIGVDTIYSPRKFVGVSDGGYLYTDSEKRLDIEKDISYNRYKYLLKRIDLGASEAYVNFLENEKILDGQDIKEMSVLTDRLLSSIDYYYIIKHRNKNFDTLNNAFKDINEIKISDSLSKSGAMVYPLLINKDIKKFLIENKIYVATYWPDVLERVDNDSFEAYLTKNLIPLPIDQRYTEEDMKYIIDKINMFDRGV